MSFIINPYRFAANFVKKSLIFTAASSQYLDRTWGTPSDNKKKTVSLWFKRASAPASEMFLVSAWPGSGGEDGLWFDSSNYFSIYATNGGAGGQSTTQVTDSNWHHLCYNLDTTQATAADRIKAWLDGTLLSGFSAPTLNATNDRLFNAQNTTIGRNDFSSNKYFDGKIAGLCIIPSACYDYTYFYASGRPKEIGRAHV